MKIRKIPWQGAASAVGILLVTAVAQPVYSQPNDDVVVNARPVLRDPDVLVAQVTFRVADLRLPEGQRSLIERVKLATHEVCPEADARFYDAERADCRREAWNGAKPQIDRAVARAMSMAANSASVPMTITIVAAR